MGLDLENFMALKNKLWVGTAPFISASNSHIFLSLFLSWYLGAWQIEFVFPQLHPQVLPLFAPASVPSYQLRKVKLPKRAQGTARKKKK